MSCWSRGWIWTGAGLNRFNLNRFITHRFAGRKFGTAVMPVAVMPAAVMPAASAFKPDVPIRASLCEPTNLIIRRHGLRTIRLEYEETHRGAAISSDIR